MSYRPECDGNSRHQHPRGLALFSPELFTMTVNPNLPVSLSIAAGANPVCSGTSVTYTATPANGGLAPSYQWKVGGINVGINSTSFSYTPTNGNTITCLMTSNAICATGNPATSNVVTMTVNPNPNTGPLYRKPNN